MKICLFFSLLVRFSALCALCILQQMIKTSSRQQRRLSNVNDRCHCKNDGMHIAHYVSESYCTRYGIFCRYHMHSNRAYAPIETHNNATNEGVECVSSSFFSFRCFVHFLSISFHSRQFTSKYFRLKTLSPFTL